MPPIVLKVGSAFIGNAFGRSLNAQTATRDGHGRLDPARRPYVSGLGKRTKRHWLWRDGCNLGRAAFHRFQMTSLCDWHRYAQSGRLLPNVGSGRANHRKFLGRKLSSCALFFRHVSLSNKSRDAAVILFEIAARCTFSLRRSALVLAPPKQRIFDNALGSPCASPQSGAGANGLTKCTRQMALITKTTNSGNLREILIGSQQ